jgi:transcription antitermination factor NusB
MISRRGGREFAMQVLYASEVGDETLEKVADRLASSESSATASEKKDAVSADSRQYGLQLARAVRMRAGEIDRLIRGVSEHWDVDRLAVVDRIILRMAIAELISEPDVPSKVCINEAVEIAKKFSTENSSSFVNGILDAVAKQLQNPPALTPEITDTPDITDTTDTPPSEFPQGAQG